MLPSGSVAAYLSPVFTGQWFTRRMTAVVVAVLLILLLPYGCMALVAGVLSSSRPHHLPSSEGSLHPEVFFSICMSSVAGVGRLLCHLSRSPLLRLFLSLPGATSSGDRSLPPPWDSLLAYAFPPWSILPQVLAKLRSSKGTLLPLVAPSWPQHL